jgi:hypothetical protein
MSQSWFPWLRRSSAHKQARRTRRTSRPPRSLVPRLDVLEDRTLPSPDFSQLHLRQGP